MFIELNAALLQLTARIIQLIPFIAPSATHKVVEFISTSSISAMTFQDHHRRLIMYDSDAHCQAFV